MDSHNHVSRKRNIDGEFVPSFSMESASQMDNPICLIENTMDHEGSKLVVNPEAINILSKIHQPVVVVSIVGMYRTGKSYLMNRLAGAQKGFVLGPTVQSVTKGIWMWCIPHPTLADHVLVLLDTEGLGDVRKGDLKNDRNIFALAVLLSSILVYNNMKTIDEDALNKLKLVGEITELIKLKTGNVENEEANYSTYFPIFIWAVRDVTLEMEIDGETITADEYLENSLKLKKPERSPEDTRYNHLRKQIRMYFGTRKCFLFDTPTDSKRELKELEHLSDDRLEKSFVDQSALFCNYIYKNAKVKTVDITINVTGRLLGELAKLYSAAINSKVACLEEVVVSLAESENTIAIQEATKFYEDKMRKIVMPTETLNKFLDLNRECEKEAREIFLKRSIKDNDQKFLKEFVENIKRIRMDFCRINEEKSQEKCKALIMRLSENLEEALAEGTFRKPGGHREFQRALKTIKEKYNNEEGKGMKAEAVLKEYMTSKLADEIVIMQEDNALSQKEKDEEAEKAKREMEEMKERLQQLKEEQENRKTEEEKANLRMTIQRLEEAREEEKRKMNEKLEHVTKEKERELDLYRNQGCNEEASRYQEHCREVQREREQRGLFTRLGTFLDSVLFGNRY